jgi:hypothetical protein
MTRQPEAADLAYEIIISSLAMYLLTHTAAEPIYLGQYDGSESDTLDVEEIVYRFIDDPAVSGEELVTTAMKALGEDAPSALGLSVVEATLSDMCFIYRPDPARKES